MTITQISDALQTYVYNLRKNGMVMIQRLTPGEMQCVQLALDGYAKHLEGPDAPEAQKPRAAILRSALVKIMEEFPVIDLTPSLAKAKENA